MADPGWDSDNMVGKVVMAAKQSSDSQNGCLRQYALDLVIFRS